MSSMSTSHQKRRYEATARLEWNSDLDSESEDECEALKNRQKAELQAKRARQANEERVRMAEEQARMAEERADEERVRMAEEQARMAEEQARMAEERADEERVMMAEEQARMAEDEDEITLLGECTDSIVGFGYRVDHPGARNLSNGDKLSIEVDLTNEQDATAVRFLNENNVSCGFLSKDSDIKAILATIVLQRKYQPNLNWLNRIEVTYIGPDDQNRGYRGWVRMQFFGSVNNLGRLHGTMEAVGNFYFI